MMAWQQAIIWTNGDPIRWRIYAALEGDELVNKTSSHKKTPIHAEYVITVTS